MSMEYKLPFTAKEVEEKLNKVDNFSELEEKVVGKPLDSLEWKEGYYIDKDEFFMFDGLKQRKYIFSPDNRKEKTFIVDLSEWARIESDELSISETIDGDVAIYGYASHYVDGLLSVRLSCYYIDEDNEYIRACSTLSCAEYVECIEDTVVDLEKEQKILAKTVANAGGKEVGSVNLTLHAEYYYDDDEGYGDTIIYKLGGIRFDGVNYPFAPIAYGAAADEESGYYPSYGNYYDYKPIKQLVEKSKLLTFETTGLLEPEYQTEFEVKTVDISKIHTIRKYLYFDSNNMLTNNCLKDSDFISMESDDFYIFFATDMYDSLGMLNNWFEVDYMTEFPSGSYFGIHIPKNVLSCVESMAWNNDTAEITITIKGYN